MDTARIEHAVARLCAAIYGGTWRATAQVVEAPDLAHELKEQARETATLARSA